MSGKRGWMRRAVIAIFGVVVIVVAALWLLFPWGPIAGLSVERAWRLAAPANAAPGPARRAQIAVLFSTPASLDAIRTDKDAGFINATLSACDDAERVESEVASQRAGYFTDSGRVRALPAADRASGDATRRHAYRALFDDPGAGAGDLCFALTGGSMWAGKLWSDHIRLRLR